MTREETRCPAEYPRHQSDRPPVRCSLPIGHQQQHQAAIHDNDDTDRFYVW